MGASPSVGLQGGGQTRNPFAPDFTGELLPAKVRRRRSGERSGGAIIDLPESMIMNLSRIHNLEQKLSKARKQLAVCRAEQAKAHADHAEEMDKLREWVKKAAPFIRVARKQHEQQRRRRHRSTR